MGTRGQGSVVAGIVALAVLVAAGLVVAEGDTLKIGFVDVQKVLNESAKGKEAKGKLEKERDAKQQEIRAREQEIRAQQEQIKKLEADLQKQAPVLSEAARKERQDAITRKIRDVGRVVEDLRRLFEDSNRDLQKRETDLLNEILREIRKVVVAYGKEQAYTLILEAQSGIIYASQGADLTDEILAAFNRQK